MNIIERDKNGVTLFVLEGRIDTEGAVDMDLALQATASGGKHRLVLNMAAVDYISSAALRTMVDVVNSSREQGGDLKLASLSRRVLRVFRIIGFDRVFSLYDTVEEAVADF
jgi:anti-sigma B factor antagonist